jgi:hypothetical protein
MSAVTRVPGARRHEAPLGRNVEEFEVGGARAE